MRKHFSSLRSQMMLLTTGTVLAVVILATVFYSSAQRMSEKKAATFVHSMLVQLGDSLDRIGNEMSYLGSALHSNEVLQQYYHAPTAIQRMQYGKSFIDFSFRNSDRRNCFIDNWINLGRSFITIDFNIYC